MEIEEKNQNTRGTEKSQSEDKQETAFPPKGKQEPPEDGSLPWLQAPGPEVMEHMDQKNMENMNLKKYK